MRKQIRLLLLLALPMLLGLAACSDKDISKTDNPVNPQNPGVEIPTEDQLTVKVTADMPTAVMSSFDDNSMGGALVRRLSQTTGEVTPETKMILIKGEDILGRPVSEWLEATKIYLRGGYIAVEKPHNAQLVNLMEQLSDKFVQAEEEMLLKGGVSIVRTAHANMAALSSHVNLFKARIANIAARAGESDDKPVAELVIFSRNGYYHQDAYQGKTFTSEKRKKDGTVEKRTVEYNPDYNNFSSGRMADGAAQWLNSRNTGGSSRSAASGTRASGEKAINEIMSADDEWTYVGPLYAVDFETGINFGWNMNYVSKPNAQQEIMRIWASHNLESNKDYYFVQHSSMSSVGGKKEGDERLDPTKTLYRGPYGEDEWEERHYKPEAWDHDVDDYYSYYGDWYDNSEFSFNVTGAGTAMVEAALPSTDKNEISKTVTAGEFNGQITTLGGTGSVTRTGGGATGAVNRGWVSGSFYSLSTTTTVQELACQKNTDGTKVTWKYHESQNMAEGDDDEHPLIGDGLINDVDVSNQVCWSVSNPSGQYILDMTHQVKMANICHERYIDHNSLNGVRNEKFITLSNAIADNQVNVKYALPIPNRASQKWNMDVTFPELNKDGYSEVKTKLTAALLQQFPSVYQPELILADQTPESETTIRQVVTEANNQLMNENALQTLRDYAKDYKISEFTIKWYSTNVNQNTYQFTVKAEGDPVGVDLTVDPIDLSKLTADYVAHGGDVLTGTLAGNYKITIANGAVVTLNNVTINGTNDDACSWAGITCQGNATIVLADKSKNVVKGFRSNQPGIYVPEVYKLIIQGNTGTLDASSNGEGCGIGGSNIMHAGNITIQGGIITATGGEYSAGIGAGFGWDCGDIVISGGTVTATGGKNAAGIGCGASRDEDASTCGNITISGGTVTATGDGGGAGIGLGGQVGDSYGRETGNITITKGVKSVTATGGIKGSGTITIEEGANVIQK